jgi:hypothetical protein
MKIHRERGWAAALLVLAGVCLMAPACAAYFERTEAATATAQAVLSATQEARPPTPGGAKNVLSIGEAADLGGIMVTLSEASFDSGILRVTVKLQNTTAQPFHFSPGGQLKPSTASGAVATQISCGGVGTTGGDVPGGSTTTTPVCWFLGTLSENVTVTFDATAEGKGKATFAIPGT